MTTPRGLTQPFTSFIGSACQGIHHAPLITNTQTTHTTKSADGHTSELDKKLIKEKRNHTNTHKQTTKMQSIRACLMLASTIQFSHNTPTTTCQHTQCQQDSWSGTKKGNNAPDTQQCTNIQTTYFSLCTDNVCHKAPFKHSACLIRSVFHPDNFSTIKAGSMTLAYSTNQGCNCTRIIKAP